jgi:hypothetical protein
MLKPILQYQDIHDKSGINQQCLILDQHRSPPFKNHFQGETHIDTLLFSFKCQSQ